MIYLNDKATPYKLNTKPKIVRKEEIPDGYLLRMGKGVQKFLLVDYDTFKCAEIGNYNILKVQRKGKGRYMPFITSIDSIR